MTDAGWLLLFSIFASAGAAALFISIPLTQRYSRRLAVASFGLLTAALVAVGAAAAIGPW